MQLASLWLANISVIQAVATKVHGNVAKLQKVKKQ